MLRRLAIATLVISCSSDTDSSTSSSSGGGGGSGGAAGVSPESQFRSTLGGEADEQTLAVVAAIRDTLEPAEEASLASLDWSQQTGDGLLGNQALMRAWGVVASALVGVKPMHGTTHADCSGVGDVMAGWATVTGSILEEVTGQGAATDVDAASAAVLFFAKKCAQNYVTTIDGPFTLATHCSSNGGAGGGALCGTPGDPCCDGSCFEGTTCLGGLCL